MAFDGTMIACIADELNNTILNGRISKVAQPEKDSLLLTIKHAKAALKQCLGQTELFEVGNDATA